MGKPVPVPPGGPRSGAAVVQRMESATKRVIRVGVSFRIDQSGKAHSDYDVPSIKAAQSLFPGAVIEVVPLPRSASGSAIPDRTLNWQDLDGIDMIYIPGSPSANSTQIGTSTDKVKNAEERSFNVPTKSLQQNEHASRSKYELGLINMARTRGIPLLAVCAGSWRLLEGYGGVVRTLPEGQREKHKAKEPSNTWKIDHGVKISRGSMLHGIIGFKGLAHTNSTHWAVAAEDRNDASGIQVRKNKLKIQVRTRKEDEEDPNNMLQVVARTAGIGAGVNTVEAFETKFGTPHIGIQWHPESNLPGMPGRDTATKQHQLASDRLFKAMLTSANAFSGKRDTMAELTRGAIFGPRLKVALGLKSDFAGRQVYSEICKELGTIASEQEVLAYLRTFNITSF